MKKRILTLCLLLALLAGVCCPAAAENVDIIGLWVLDIADVLVQQGYTPEQADALMRLSALKVTVEFTEEGQLVVAAEQKGAVQQHETVPYTLEGNQIMANGLPGEVRLEGDMLFLTENGIEYRLTRMCAGETDERLLGLWEVDLQSVAGSSGMKQEEYSALLAQDPAMKMTMQFTAEGILVMEGTFMGETQRQEKLYSVLDGKIVTNNESAAYFIQGDVLVLYQETMAMVLYRAAETIQE